MALSLGVTVGSEIDFRGPGVNSRLHVDEIVGGTQVKVTVTQPSKPSVQLVIDDESRKEILPDVFVQCGLSSATRGSRSSRLAFEAPKSIKIDRVPKNA